MQDVVQQGHARPWRVYSGSRADGGRHAGVGDVEHVERAAGGWGAVFFSRPGGGNLLGEKLFDDRVTLRSDPRLSGGEAAPFTGEGQPQSPVTWVENGVVKDLFSSRF